MKSLLPLLLHFRTEFVMIVIVHPLALSITVTDMFAPRALDAGESIAVFILTLVKSNEVTESSLDEIGLEIHHPEQEGQVSTGEELLLQLLP